MRILLTGASGQLGAYVLRDLVARGADVAAWSGSRTGTLCGVPLRPVDLADRDQVAAAFREARPDAIVHAGALSTVAGCFRDPGRAQHINVGGTATLAELAAASAARLLFTSTDLVFDGEHAPYPEDASPQPLSVYGASKAAAEPYVRAVPRGLVVRLSLLFGPSLTGRPAFFDQLATALRERRPVPVFRDEWRTPLGLAAAARALGRLVTADVVGTLHLGGPERLSRLEMAQRLAAYLGADAGVLVATTRNHVPADEPRPRDTSLDSSRWRSLFPDEPWPGWQAMLQAMYASV